MTSQLIDAIIVNPIILGFGLGLDWAIVTKIIIAACIFRLLMAADDTSFVYRGVGIVRQLDPAVPARGAELG